MFYHNGHRIYFVLARYCGAMNASSLKPKPENLVYHARKFKIGLGDTCEERRRKAEWSCAIAEFVGIVCKYGDGPVTTDAHATAILRAPKLYLATLRHCSLLHCSDPRSQARTRNLATQGTLNNKKRRK